MHPNEQARSPDFLMRFVLWATLGVGRVEVKLKGTNATSFNQGKG